MLRAFLPLRPIAAIVAAGALSALSAGAPLVAHAQGFRVLGSFSGPQIDDEAPSPDGRFLARSTAKRLAIYDVASRREYTLAPTGGWSLAWAPRGDGLAFVRGDDAGEGDYIWYVGIDPASGQPRGTPRRVTVGQGEYPAISGDGKSIAYEAKDTGTRHLIKVLPLNGGVERVVGRVDGGIDALNWAADDKYLVFDGPVPGGQNKQSGTIRLDVATGQQRAIGPVHVWLTGVTQDRRHMIVVPASSPTKAGDSASMIDIEGNVVGRGALPTGDVNEYSGVFGERSLLWIELVDRKRIDIADANGQHAIHLPLLGTNDLYPNWSPDGSRLSLLVLDGGAYHLAVVNADGRNAHVYRDTQVRPGEWTVRWAPDSRSLAFEGVDNHSIWLMDIARGAARRIFHDGDRVPGRMMFTADGSAIQFSSGRVGTPWAGAVQEVTTSGQSRILRTTDGITITGIAPLGPDRYYLRTDSGAFITDASLGNWRRVGSTTPNTVVWMPSASSDGSMIIGRISNPSGQGTPQLEITDTRAGTVRVIEAPFKLDASGHFPILRAGNRSVLLFGRQSSDSSTKIYELPLDGGAHRVIADVGVVSRDASVAVSPDGSRIAYSVQPDYSLRNLVVVPIEPTAARGTASRQKRP